MALQIQMTPDANGVIRLSCGGQMVEIVVTSPPAATPPAPVSGAPAAPKPARPSAADRPVIRFDTPRAGPVATVLDPADVVASLTEGARGEPLNALLAAPEAFLDLGQLIRIARSLDETEPGSTMEVRFGDDPTG